MPSLENSGNGKALRTALSLITTALILAGIIWNASRISTQAAEAKAQSERNTARIESLEKSLIVLSKDIEYIKEGIDKLVEKQERREK